MTAKKKKAAKKKKVVKKTAKKKVAPKKEGSAAAVIAGFVDTASDVKLRIITNSPLSGLEVAELDDELLLRGNLEYQSGNIGGLTISLDEYVNDRDPSEHVTTADMSSCTTVGKTISMVKTKLNES